ncbi:RNA-binding protein 34 isoform X2 [Stigmatopora nigra]
MRKKAPSSAEASSSYCLGQVSGSLSKCAASASLSALFGASAAPPTGKLFVPVGGDLSQPAPPVGGDRSQPGLPVGGNLSQPAPPVGGVLSQPAPPAGGVLSQPAPPAGGVLSQPAPPAGGVLSQPAPPAGGVLSQPAPPAGGVLSQPPAQLQAQFPAGRHKKPKVKTEGELRLERRELSLLTADEAGRAPARRKRAVREAQDGPEGQRWTSKRRRREDRTAFVGNLPSDCTEKMLLGLFRNDGAVESIRFRSLVREDLDVSQRLAAVKRQARPCTRSINAYVVFRKPEGVVKAMCRNGTEIQKDYIIRVDRVSQEAQKTHDHKRSVFVGNLDFELQELALRHHFQDCGTVKAVRLVRDQRTGLGKGFGYVLFESSDSVQLALKLDGSHLKGRAVRVQRSSKKKADGAPAEKKAGGRAPAKKAGGRAPAKKATAAAVNVEPRHAFKGEMAEPTPRGKKKTGQKKLKKRGKRVC